MPKTRLKSRARKRRVLLLCDQALLADGLRVILGRLKDVELAGPVIPDAQGLNGMPEDPPDVVLVSEEGDELLGIGSLTARVLERYPDVPVIRMGLRRDSLRLYTSRTLPASSAELIEAIRRMPVSRPGVRQAVGLKTKGTKGERR